MGMMRPTVLASTVLAIGMLTALTGCTDGSTPTAGASSSTATPTSSPSASVSPKPSATAVAVPATCENLVTPATLTGFTSDGLHITPPAEFAAKMHDEGNAIGGFADAGGVICQVGDDYNATEIYGWAPSTGSQAMALQQGLADQGWSPSAGDGGVLYTLPPNTDDVMNRCLFTGTAMACAFGEARLTEVLAHAPS